MPWSWFVLVTRLSRQQLWINTLSYSALKLDVKPLPPPPPPLNLPPPPVLFQLFPSSSSAPHLSDPRRADSASAAEQRRTGAGETYDRGAAFGLTYSLRSRWVGSAINCWMRCCSLSTCFSPVFPRKEQTWMWAALPGEGKWFKSFEVTGKQIFTAK